MKVEITGVAPTPPEQRVVLDLSVEEFALLEHLRFKHLSGSGSLRTQIDEGFERAKSDLAPHWRTKVVKAQGYKKSVGMAGPFVAGIFAG